MIKTLYSSKANKGKSYDDKDQNAYRKAIETMRNYEDVIEINWEEQLIKKV